MVMLLAVGIVARAEDKPDAGDDTLALLVDVIKSTEDPASQADMLRGLSAAMEGKKNVKMPAGWAELSPKLIKSPNEEVRKLALRLSATFGDVGTLDAMKKTVADVSKPADERMKALEGLMTKPDPSMAGLLQSLLKDPVPPLREAAIKGLAAFEDPNTPVALLAAYEGFDADAKRAAVNLLSFRKAYAQQLIAAVKGGKVPAKDLTAYTVRQLRNVGDKEIDAFVTQTWGVARSTPDDKLKQIEQYKKMLTPDVLAKADASAGRAIYAKTCQQCHMLYGEGGKVGPDLTGSNRADIDYLMVNIVDPSAVIAKDYQVTNIWTKEGDILSGIMTREDEKSVTLMTETTTSTIERKDIDTIKKSELSMMPEGILLPMSPKELADLVVYLRSTGQVALPAAPK